MEINQSTWIYDLESFPNFFSGLFWNGIEKKEFIIFEERNDLGVLVDFLLTQKDLLLVGYNSLSYDNTILHYLLSEYSRLNKLTSDQVTARINKLSGYIINLDNQTKVVQSTVRDFRSKKYFKTIDLLEVIREGYSTKSLKAVAINLKWHRIQDLPYEFDKVIQANEVDSIMEYNFNDVLITELIYRHLADRLEMRRILSQQYQLDLLTDADSGIAKKLFTEFYAQGSGMHYDEFKHKRTRRTELKLKDVILDWIEFKTSLYQNYLAELKEVRVWNMDKKVLTVDGKVIKDVQFTIPSLIIGDMEYTIGLGGIHSVDKPGIFEATEDTILLDLDVASQYPNRILKSEFVPEHLDKSTFLPILQGIVDTRLAKKKEGKTDKIARIISEGLKITVNTVYGLYNFDYYFLKDAKATYQVTINNQLAILMLIELLNENNINIISANTDGIICHTSSQNLDRIREIYKAWEILTQFTLEETNYSKYIRRDINNYLTIKTDGEIKAKGDFVPQLGILKGYDKPIVAIAVQEYFLHNKKPSDVIKKLGTPYRFVNPEFPKGEDRVTDIYDYCMAQKIGPTYNEAVICKDGVETITQRSVRYYASNEGVMILKKKKVGEEWSSQTLLASSPVTIFNDYIAKEDYDVNYNYYIEQAERMIAQIEGRVWIDLGKLEEKIGSTKEKYDKVVTNVQIMIANSKQKLKSFAQQVTRGEKLADELNQLIKQRDEYI